MPELSRFAYINTDLLAWTNLNYVKPALCTHTGNPRSVQTVILLLLNDVDANTLPTDRRSPLHLAALHQQLPIAKAPLTAEADAEVEDCTWLVGAGLDKFGRSHGQVNTTAATRLCRLVAPAAGPCCRARRTRPMQQLWMCLSRLGPMSMHVRSTSAPPATSASTAAAWVSCATFCSVVQPPGPRDVTALWLQ